MARFSRGIPFPSSRDLHVQVALLEKNSYRARTSAGVAMNIRQTLLNSTEDGDFDLCGVAVQPVRHFETGGDLASLFEPLYIPA